MNKNYELRKKYNLNNIPQRDRKLLLLTNDRFQIVNHLPEIIKNNSPDHDIYFKTITFKNTKRKVPYESYEEYFKYAMMRFNNSLLCKKQFHKAPALILFPEKSFQCTIPILHECLHFHGFLMINKDTSEKFKRKCITSDMSEHSDLVTLKSRFIDPYPQSIKDDFSRSRLQVDDYKIYKIQDVDSFFRTSRYSGKRFFKDFEYDQIIVERLISTK